MPRRYIGDRAHTPHLPFERPATLPTANPVFALYKDVAHQITIAGGTTDPMLPDKKFDAAGGRYNLDYAWLANYSDPAVESARGNHGGRPQARVRVPPYPRRGIGVTNTEYAADGWRVIDFATELGWAKDAGITGMLCEATSQDITNQQVKIYHNLFDGADRVGGIFPALQFDSVAMGNNLYDAENYADITVAGMLRSSYFADNGVMIVGAFEPAQLTNGSSNVPDIPASAAWLDAFFARLATRGVVNIAFAPLYSGWSDAEYDGFRPYMERVAGFKSWAGRVDINNPVTVARQIEHAAYIRAHGGHRVAWAVRPQALYPHNGFYYEPGGWTTLKTQYETALENRLPGDAIYKFTWNDLLEGAECCPCDRTQWAILDVCTYYNTWWRTGSPPEIVRDCLYYMHRLHAFDALPNLAYQTLSRTGMLSGNRFYNSTQSIYPARNIISVLVFLTAVADVEIVTPEGTTTHTNVPAGVTLLEAPLPVTKGGRPQFRVKRDGQTIIDLPSAFRVRTAVPYWQDLLHGAGGSLRHQLGRSGYGHPYIEPVELVRDFLKGEVRYG